VFSSDTSLDEVLL